jgi:hypothetical protein
MADKDSYVTGQGMFGGAKGSYGRYSVSGNVSSLSPAQFNTMSDIEEQQRRRYKRKHEPNFSGAGFWFWNYPYMVGTIGSGSMLPVRDNDVAQQEGNDRTGETASVDSGLGQGGTASSAAGAAGGSPA